MKLDSWTGKFGNSFSDLGCDLIPSTGSFIDHSLDKMKEKGISFRLF